MKKTLYVKLDCRLEKEIDRQDMNDFFQKMKELLKLSHKLPQKNIPQEKTKKI